MQVIPYYPLSDDMLSKIVELQLDRIVKRIKDNHGIDLPLYPEVLKLITSRCTEVESGGRMIDAILTNTVLPQISQELLTCATQGTSFERKYRHQAIVTSITNIKYKLRKKNTL